VLFRSHENYNQNITIDNIADYIGISYSYLRMLYKEATGCNLNDYINQLRLQKAKQLLLETNYTVKEIVSMCGFNHERSFFRSFTQSEGISPSKYRELNKTAHKTSIENV
jgi:two-component system response regulator YesN